MGMGLGMGMGRAVKVELCDHCAQSHSNNGGLLDGQRVQTVNVRRSSPYQKPPAWMTT